MVPSYVLKNENDKKKNKRKRKKKDGDQSKRPPKITKIIELNNESDKQKFLEALFGLNPIDPLEENDEKVEDVVEDVCPNPLCDCKDLSEGEIFIKKKITKINNINDLIELGKSYHCKKNTTFNNLDLKILCNLVKPLTDLNNMIGMEKVKKDMVNQIVFFLQGFNSKSKCNNCVDCSFGNECKNISNDDMLHTIITGPPGVGKTELGKILGYVYKGMGVLKKGTLKIVKRSDLIGKYLGHTAAKTQDVIDECSGGVMFIDEAYSLGNKDGRDSFSKECIDTLNQNLTERRDFLCIIAGYEDSLNNCFFNYNEGLKRRFSFRYNIESYSPEELRDIFLLKIKKECWEFEFKKKRKKKMDDLTSFFRKNIKFFPHYGGDIETFLLNCKIYHSRRVFLLPEKNKRIITMDDIMHGFDTFKKDRNYKDTDHNNNLNFMYL